MYIEQLYTNCLAEAAYYVESNGEAVIIDPIRETDQYVQMAASRGAQIKYILETHFHADFVSGHLDLAAKTGAPIVFGPDADTMYDVHHAQDGEKLRVGALTIEVLHTPGHTPESTCYLLYDESGAAHAVFTGDTLFVGDVGRPDLLGGTMSKEELAGLMYDSLSRKIKPLADSVIVYPAHGPGSACGKNIGRETFSTIGVQKRTNYALKASSREDLIQKLTTGLTAPPPYYFADAAINKRGYEPLAAVVSRNLKPLTPSAIAAEVALGAMILDTRIADDFEKGFIADAVNIGLDGKFAQWVGTLIDIGQPLVVVAEEGKEEETMVRLARVGYEAVMGYLDGGMSAWINADKPIATIHSIDPADFPSARDAGAHVIDTRNPGETDNGFVEGATLIPLASLTDSEGMLQKDGEYLIHCGGGYRSMIAASLLRRDGFTNLTNVRGGYAKIKDTGVPIVVPEESLV